MGDDHDEVIHSDQYYAAMLKALKEDEDRHASAPSKHDFGPVVSAKNNKANQIEDITSPYYFMKTMKFHLWNKSFQTKNNDQTLEFEQKKELKATRDEQRLVFLSNKEADCLNLLPKSGEKARLLLNQLQSIPRTSLER
jgi:hypothetical protein